MIGQLQVGYLIAVGSGRAVGQKDPLITPALPTCSYTPRDSQLQWPSRCNQTCHLHRPSRWNQTCHLHWPSRWNQTCHLHHHRVDPTEHCRTHLLHRLTDFSWCSEVCFCLAPFEIGYDVGGKAAALRSHASLVGSSLWLPGRWMGREGEGGDSFSC